MRYAPKALSIARAPKGEKREKRKKREKKRGGHITVNVTLNVEQNVETKVEKNGDQSCYFEQHATVLMPTRSFVVCHGCILLFLYFLICELVQDTRILG